MRSSVSNVFLVVLLSLANMASAQTYCGKAGRGVGELMGEDIFGDWAMTPLKGYAVEDGEYFPFPPMATQTMSIFPGEGGRLFAVNPELADKVELVADENPDSPLIPADFPDQIDPPLNEQEIAAAAGCDASDLPRLIVRSRFETDDSRLDMTMRLIVIGPGLMFGIIDSSGTIVGDSFTAVRAISLTK